MVEIEHEGIWDGNLKVTLGKMVERGEVLRRLRRGQVSRNGRMINEYMRAE